MTSEARLLWMRLVVGWRATTLEDAAGVVERVLDVPLRRRDDPELGGLWFGHEPEPPPALGVDQVRVRANADAYSGLPRRPDLVSFAEISFGSRDLLDLGRLSVLMSATGGHDVVMAGYMVAEGRSGEELERGPFWRAHRLEFDARGDAPTRAARFECQLVVGCGNVVLEQAQGQVQALLPVELTVREDPDLGGRFLESTPGAALGPLTQVLVRSNQLDRWSPLYPRRSDHEVLAQVTLATPSLLDLGRVAASFEAADPGWEPVAYTVVGDLAHDRVIRVLEREFVSPAESRSPWRPPGRG